MSSDYPSSVPSWNKLRWETPNVIDLDNVEVFSYQMPVAFFPYFWGAFSLLMDINSWEKIGTLTPENMVDIANNEVIPMDICELVADCVLTSTEVTEAIAYQIEFNQTIQDAVRGQAGLINNYYSTGEVATSENEDLDYVWGGLVNALPVWQDAVAEAFVLLNASSDVRDAILGLLPFDPVLDVWRTAVTGAFDIGIALVETYLTDTSTEEEWLCLIFDQICSAGTPYLLYDEYINNAMEQLGGIGLPALGSAGMIPGGFFNFSKFKQLYTLGTDTPDNDWSTLCSCEPTWEHVFDLSETLPSEFTLTDGLQISSGIMQQTKTPGPIPRITIDIDIAASDSITFLELILDRGNAGASGTSKLDGAGVIGVGGAWDVPNAAAGTDIVRSFSGSLIGGTTLRVYSTNGNTGSPSTFSTILYKQLTIRGTGADPFA